MAADEDLGRLVAELQQKVEILERATQVQHSTVQTASGTVGVGDAVATSVETAAALPVVEEQASTAQDTADSVAVLADGWDADLDDRLDAAAAALDDARADLEDSQSDIEDAFGQTVEGLSDDVETAITAAGDAKTEAEAASEAALDAAGLAASKGKTIVQVSAPTGANADPANLWINISTDANGVPKNQPNRYNPDTAKWEPITDAQAVAAAQTAATAVAAAQAAKDTADQANAAAAVAKQAASDANTQALAAAGIANGKGKVIYQASAPTGSNATAANLWIRTTDNTPWTYDVTNAKWVQVTDKTATDAATAASAAQQAATAAANAASAAQATADSKPLILFSSTAGPSGTAPTGSTWFLWDSAKNIAGQWLQSGTLANPVWTPQQITSQVIANVDLGKLTAGSASIADLVAQKIAASTANFQTANVSNLFVTSGATLSQAVIDFLFANVVQAKKITAGMIDVDSLSGITLTGATIKTAASGQRIELSGTSLRIYDPNGTWVGTIQADVAGRIRIGQVYTATNFLFGTFTTANGNTADIGVDTGSSRFAAPVILGGVYSLDLPGAPQFASPYNSLDGSVVGGVKLSADYASIGAIFSSGVIMGDDFQTRDGTSISADTGWVTLPLASGFVAHSSRTPAIRMKGGVIYCRGGIAKSDGSAFAGSAVTIANLPAAFQGAYPANQYLPVFNGFSGSVGTVTLPSNRTVIQYQANIASSTYVYLDSVSWPTP